MELLLELLAAQLQFIIFEDFIYFKLILYFWYVVSFESCVPSWGLWWSRRGDSRVSQCLGQNCRAVGQTKIYVYF